MKRFLLSVMGMIVSISAIESTDARAQDSRYCNCAVYMRTSLREAFIVDHDHGWIDEKFGNNFGSLEPEKPGSPGYRKGQMVDCSEGEMRCAELRALKLVLAFKDGEVGSTYNAKNTQFTIFSKSPISRDPLNILYNIRITYPNLQGHGRMLYTTANGVVAIFVENERVGDFLVSGPGVLAKNGFPRAKR